MTPSKRLRTRQPGNVGPSSRTRTSRGSPSEARVDGTNPKSNGKTAPAGSSFPRRKPPVSSRYEYLFRLPRGVSMMAFSRPGRWNAGRRSIIRSRMRTVSGARRVVAAVSLSATRQVSARIRGESRSSRFRVGAAGNLCEGWAGRAGGVFGAARPFSPRRRRRRDGSVGGAGRQSRCNASGHSPRADAKRLRRPCFI